MRRLPRLATRHTTQGNATMGILCGIAVVSSTTTTRFCVTTGAKAYLLEIFLHQLLCYFLLVDVGLIFVFFLVLDFDFNSYSTFTICIINFLIKIQYMRVSYLLTKKIWSRKTWVYLVYIYFFRYLRALLLQLV